MSKTSKPKLYFRGQPRPEVFPIRKSTGLSTESSGQGEVENRIAPAVTSNLKRGVHSGGEAYIAQLNHPRHSNNRIYADNGISPALNTAQGGNRQPKIAHTVRSSGRASGINTKQNWDSYEFDGKIRRLTPTECERLQGFPDGWTRDGLSSIMEICVNINPVIENLLPKSDIAFSITKDGSVMEFLNYQKELKSDVSIVVDQLLLVNSVIDTINLGKDMVMLYGQKEILKNVDEIKKNLILESMEGKSTKMLLSLYLEGNWNEARLSTILTSIKETIASPTSMFAKIDENIIGVIIHLNRSEQNYSGRGLYALRMANITSISDTQRYKCLGNAVSVPVVEAIARRLNG